MRRLIIFFLLQTLFFSATSQINNKQYDILVYGETPAGIMAMEPVYMVLGQSAGTAAALSINKNLYRICLMIY